MSSTLLIRRTLPGIFGVMLLMLVMPSIAHAARPSELVDLNAWDQFLRFISLRDPGVRMVLGGSLLLGLGCGVLGGFMVVRKLALAGDALAHSVLPGVVLGFLWNLTKDPLNLFIGAVIAGMISMLAVTALRNTTKLKQDAVLGVVLSGFFAIGLCLLTMVQGISHADQAGLDHILFGQAAALGPSDLKAMAWSTGLSLVLVIVLYPKLLVLSFDTAFAASLGLPVRMLHQLLMLLLTFSVVVALQAVGVVLVSAMLITPAAAAYLITKRFHRMLIWSAIFGMMSGSSGALLSFLGSDLPTGPLMVLSASAIFAIAFLFSPREGVVMKWRRARHRSARVHRENLLKAVYHIHERENFSLDGVTLVELAAARRETLEQVGHRVAKLVKRELAELSGDGGMLFLSDAGMARAAQLVRNHRLWELYLTNAANYAPDHVHDDAERIEHVLGEPIVRELEKRLDFPDLDPHGKPIPAVAGKPV